MSSFKLFFNLFSLLTQCGNICSKSTSVDCWSFIHLCPIRIWKIIRLSCCRCWSKNISRVKRKNVKFSEHQSELIRQYRLLGKIKSKVKYKNTSEISVHRCSEEYVFKNFKGKHLQWSSFFNQVTDLRQCLACTFTKEGLSLS